MRQISGWECGFFQTYPNKVCIKGLLLFNYLITARTPVLHASVVTYMSKSINLGLLKCNKIVTPRFCSSCMKNSIPQSAMGAVLSNSAYRYYTTPKLQNMFIKQLDFKCDLQSKTKKERNGF